MICQFVFREKSGCTADHRTQAGKIQLVCKFFWHLEQPRDHGGHQMGGGHLVFVHEF